MFGVVSVAIVDSTSNTGLAGNVLYFLESMSNSGDVNSRFLPCETGVTDVDSELITFEHPLYLRIFQRGAASS